MSAKRKIYIALALWVALCAGMVFYFFKIMENSNASILDKIASEKKDLAFYRVEGESYQLARKDIEEMKSKTYQPENLFSKDITFVNEIKILENLGDKLNLNLALSGIGGTVKNAAKAKTIGDIVVIPYGISVSAPFARAVDFMEILENLNFVTSVSSVSLSASPDGKVNASLSASFYLKRQ